MNELATHDQSWQLVKYDEMCRAIDAAYSYDEVKDIRDKALAMAAYFKQAKNPEPERRACEIRLRAERRSGQMIAEMEKHEGGRPLENQSYAATGYPPTLAELGITKDQSSKWQQLAALPQEEFEARLAGPDMPSTSGILAKPLSRMHPQALWFWGRMRDFEKNLLVLSRDALLVEMTEGMQEDVRRLIPLVTTWLKGDSHD